MTIASIDIGTNTVLMVIVEYDESSGKLKTLRNEHNIPRIGKGLEPGKPISDEKKQLLLDILISYKKIAEEYNCRHIIAIATNAFRIASNSEEIITQVKSETGIEIQIVPGEDESHLAYLGAASGYHSKDPLLVIDIGGGSTEIISGMEDKIFYRKSFHAGVVSFSELYFKNDPPAAGDLTLFNTALQKTFEELNYAHVKTEKAIAIAGTPTTLACIKQNMTEYDEDKIEGHILKKMEILLIISELSELSTAEILNKYKSVVKGREDVLLAGSLFLFNLMNILNLEEVIVSTKGIRYGAVIKFLKDKSL